MPKLESQHQLSRREVCGMGALALAQGKAAKPNIVIVYVDESGETTVAEITDIDADGVPDLIAMQFDTPGLLTDADAAKQLIEAAKASAPTAYKSDKAIAEEKAAAEAKAKADAARAKKKN